jgi:hypothetical protein
MAVTYVFLPPLAKPSGGLVVLHQLARRLSDTGREVVLAPREERFWRPEATAGLTVRPLGEARPGPEDYWLVPEGWPNALAPGLSAGARCLVYCQNWAFLFSGLPESARWDDLPVRFLAVSDPVARFLEEVLGVRAPVLRPGLDRSLFTPRDKADGPVRVAWMPRKNRALGRLVRDSLDAKGVKDLVWEAVEGLSPEGVAEALGRSHLFLATGFPEGCPLPPLEAMACGCLPAGFPGFGGWDYMRQAPAFPAGAAEPWFGLREVPWSGNGFWAADGDALACVQGLEIAKSLVRNGGTELEALLEAGRATAEAYDLSRQALEADVVWRELEEEEGR